MPAKTEKVRIYRTSPPPRTRVAEVPAGTRTAQVCSLTGSTDYGFVAVAVDAAGAESDDSAPVQVTTLPKPGDKTVAPPTGVTVGKETADGFTVTWTWAKGQSPADLDATGFTVRVRPKGGNWGPPVTKQPGDRQHVFTGLTADTEYDVEVTALAGEKNATGSGSGKTGKVVERFIASPTDLQVTATSTTAVTVGWKWAKGAGEDRVKQQVAHRVHGTDTWTTFDVDLTATSHEFTGLTPGTAYDFRVIESSAAPVVTGDAVITAPTAVQPHEIAPATHLVVSGETDTHLTLDWKWDKGSGLDADRFRVRIKEVGSSDPAQIVATVQADKPLTATIPALKPDTAYEVSVETIADDGTLSVITTTTAKTKPVPPPDPPAQVKITEEGEPGPNHKITFSWEPGKSGADYFTYEYSDTWDGMPPQKQSGTVAGTSAALDNAANCVTYTLRVKATKNSKDSAWTDAEPLTSKCTDAHEKPANVRQVDDQDGRVTIGWQQLTSGPVPETYDIYWTRLDGHGGEREYITFVPGTLEYTAKAPDASVREWLAAVKATGRSARDSEIVDKTTE